jgi:hypothetical protein
MVMTCLSCTIRISSILICIGHIASIREIMSSFFFRSVVLTLVILTILRLHSDGKKGKQVLQVCLVSLAFPSRQTSLLSYIRTVGFLYIIYIVT